ncbi:hypothetical protein MKZ38_005151 [Zalerion maritima]|uniref:Sulfotransferase n=1 Tax=Zalerion maritima TaxID=339359 RepID=A0AAD5WPF8_9PEZI|nr:hypothetical protein MKZ38_005151 [Zalerion maritima]
MAPPPPPGRMRHALYKLGIHDVHHMKSVLSDIDTVPLWVQAMKAKFQPSPSHPPLTRQQWDSLLGTSQGVCDVPACLFGPELLEMYPDAKIIVMDRDPASWYRSVLGSVVLHVHELTALDKLQMAFAFLFDRQVRLFAAFDAAMVNVAVPVDWTSEKQALRWYDEFYADFRALVPREKRLEYKITDGWGPLCRWLGVPVPTERDEATGEATEATFPKMHDQEEFRKNAGAMMKNAKVRALENACTLVGQGAVAWAVGVSALSIAIHSQCHLPPGFLEAHPSNLARKGPINNHIHLSGLSATDFSGAGGRGQGSLQSVHKPVPRKFSNVEKWWQIFRSHILGLEHWGIDELKVMYTEFPLKQHGDSTTIDPATKSSENPYADLATRVSALLPSQPSTQFFPSSSSSSSRTSRSARSFPSSRAP